MMRFERISATAEATEKLGEVIAGRLRGGDVILLEGDLAAGKTTLVRGLVRGLHGIADDVSSPTFVILQTYVCRHETVQVVHHVDLYRLPDSHTQLREIGLEELLSDPDAVIAIEWPKDAAGEWLPEDARCWRIQLITEDEGRRKIIVRAPQGKDEL